MNPVQLLKNAIPVEIARKKPRIDKEIALLITISAILWVIIIVVCIKLFGLQGGADDILKLASPNGKCTCLNIFEYGVKGTWIRSREKLKSHLESRNVSDKEVRQALLLPDKLHRDDLRCGLLFPLPNSTIPSACDAEGKHPCCSEHTWWCGHSVHHCTNAKSTDFSKLVSSNEAVWQQAANECKVGDISRQEACDMLNLNQMTLIFIGDSEARKTLKALLLFLTGKFSDGILENNIHASIRQKCEGEMQLLDDYCQPYTYESSIFFQNGELCDMKSSFLVEYFADFNTFVTSTTQRRLETLKDLENTYIIMSSGAHFNANPKSFIQYYLSHVLDTIEGKKWPKLIVETLPKTPSIVLSDQRASFSSQVKEFCDQHDIHVFDTFQLSNNLMPYDGKHFRLIFYLQKIKILLNFLRIETETC